MNAIQIRSIRKQIKIFEKKDSFIPSCIPILTQSMSVCILCEYQSDDQIRNILDAINQYQGQLKRIRLLVYVPLKKNPPVLERSLFIEPITKNDINFFGKLKEEAKENLQSNHYDMFINSITGSNILLSDFFSIHLDADFKITRSEESCRIYHLTLPLEPDASFIYYLETIEKYTNRLNGK